MTRKYEGKAWDEARRKIRRALAAITDEEDAAITAAALRDPDNPPWPDEMIARARPASEVHPDNVADWRRRTRGKQKAPVKTLVSLRLDDDVIAHFRDGGDGWQTRINAALRKAARLKRKAV